MKLIVARWGRSLYLDHLLTSNHAHALCKRRFMIVDPLAFRVNDLILRVTVLELLATFCDVGIHTAVAEGTLTLSFVEKSAGNLF